MRKVRRWRVAIARLFLSPVVAIVFLLALSPIAQAQVAPGGLYIGYYHEDPITNPEDPFPGALYLTLPAGDSSFAGNMFFTYFGCQKRSVGTISGSKTALSLSGRWSGPVDNTLQAGSFSGAYDATAGRYAGTYTVDGGKQFVDLLPCVQYYIAPNGTWELFPVGQNVPASFIVGISGSQVSWPATPGSVLTLLSIIDVVAATAADTNAVKWQTFLFTSTTSFDLASVGQALAQNDVLTVTTFDSLRRRLAFGSKASPTQTLAPLAGVKAITAGGFSACALTTAGGVKCWGGNDFGQLGDNSLIQRLTPVDVVGLTGGVMAIAAGRTSACALTTAGGVKCWGGSNSLTPVDVVGLTSGVMAIAAGDLHTCALTTVGGVKCWGTNGAGELGDNTLTQRPTPADVVGLTSGVMAISAGGEQTCALTAAGGVKCWGWNAYGQVGDNTLTNRLTPVDVVGLNGGITAISAGFSQTCALTTVGGVKCWGDNRFAQLGDNTQTQRLTPVDVVGLTSGVTAISAGGLRTCALTAAGGVKCWGWNGRGDLGDNSLTQRSTPVDVVGLSSGVMAISAGSGDQTCALTTAGGVKCWGWNAYGQVGDNTQTDRLIPVDVLTTSNAPPPTTTNIAIEYFHAAFGHYFVTAIPDEIAKLDAGVFVGWQRTGQTFNVYPLNTAGTANVCRFFSTSFAPKSSHFYTPYATECAIVKQNSDWQFEGEVFAVGLPDSAGNCPAVGTEPLYRMYNNGQGGAPNHRYTTSLVTRSTMLSQGWIPEGAGAIGVIACVPN